MQVQLTDRDKYSMLFLGGDLNFTYDSPGPIEIDLQALSQEQKTQLFYNWRRGILTVDQEEQLKSACEVPTPLPKSYAIPTGSEPVHQPKDVDEAIEARATKLKGILRKTVPVIKKELPLLSTVELRELLVIEKESKNRQKLVELLSEFIGKHTAAVSRSVGATDVGGKIFNPNPEALDNSLDVVESDQEDVTLIPSDKELAKDHG